MKKIIALLLAVVMVFALVACASTAKTEEKTDAPAPAETNNEQTTEPAEETDAPAEDETAEPAGDAVGTDIKIGVVLIGDENEGYTYSHIKGIQEATKALGISESNIIWKYSIPEDESCYDACVDCVDQGCQIVITNSYGHQSFCLLAAEEYPDVAFALLNGAEDTPAKAVNGNVSSLLPNAQQIGWIAGALAGLMTESGKLGFIGGMELDTTKGKIAGFEEAAKYVAEQEGKTVELLNVPYANSFSDAPKGKEFATELIAQGADVFFGDASAVDSGAREAIDAANAAAGEIKIYDIGQPADILGQNECIICSQVTDNSAMIVASMQAVIDGTFGGATLYGTLQNNTLSAGALSDLVPADVQEKYLAYIDQMIAGTFMQ